MSFIVASGSSIEVGTSSLRSGALGAMMLASSIAVGATAMSGCSGIRWGIIPELVDLDLHCYDMCWNLLNLWSVREFVELVERNG